MSKITKMISQLEQVKHIEEEKEQKRLEKELKQKQEREEKEQKRLEKELKQKQEREEKEQKQKEERLERELKQKQEREEKEAIRNQKKEEKEHEILLKEISKKEKKIKMEKEMEKFNNDIDKIYNDSKKEVEKKWFFVQDIGKFIMHDEERNKFLIHGEGSTKLNLAKYNYEIMTEKGKSKKIFFNKWIEDKERREYEEIVFDPENKNKNAFNTFTGFKLDKMENPNKSTEPIHNFLNHLFINENEKKHVLEWLAFIIINKKLTNVALCLYSHEHGVGKNTFIELIRKLIDEKYVSKLENIDELSGQFNSFLESKLFVYGDEIQAKTKDLYTFLKNTITRSQVKINKKNIDAYEVNNYANFCFTTNTRIPFPIEKKDRRLSMISVSEKKLTKEQIKEIYTALEDEDIILSFYYELKNINTPNHMECISTPLKREIQMTYEPSPIKYLFKNYKNLEGQKFGINELYEKIKSFEKSNHFTECKSSQHMSQLLKQIGDFTYRTQEQRGYYFNKLDIQLKNYCPEMFADYNFDIIDNDFENLF